MTPDVFASLDTLRVPFEEYLAEIQSVKVETTEEYEAAAMGLKALKGWQKDITDYFEPYRLRTYEAYNSVTTKMGEFAKVEQLRISEEQRAAREAEAKAMREIQAHLHTPAQPVAVSDVIVPEVSAATKVSGISVTKTWKYRITDVDAIKREFWNLNESLILKVVKDLGRGAEGAVGGIAVEEDVIIGARR